MNVSTMGAKSGPKRKKKESAKQEKIMAALLDDIVSGKYPPGGKLPIQTQLVKDFGMSSVTIQRAVHALKARGFLTAKRRQGTFVSLAPPHLTDYALIFPTQISGPQVWSNFYENLRQEVPRLEAETGKQIKCFFGIQEFEHSEDYLHLVQRVESRRLAGLIFSSPPLRLQGSPLLTAKMPRVAISSADQKDLWELPLICFNIEATLDMAVNHLLAKNRRRIGIFSSSEKNVNDWLRYHSKFASLGVETRESWSFAIHPKLLTTARACIQLLMELPPERRPDGMIVLDDHLTETVEHTLLSYSASERDIELVALCNFPDRFGHTLPIKRIGHHGMTILRLAMDLIDAQRDGKMVPKINFLTPIFA